MASCCTVNTSCCENAMPTADPVQLHAEHCFDSDCKSKFCPLLGCLAAVHLRWKSVILQHHARVLRQLLLLLLILIPFHELHCHAAPTTQCFLHCLSTVLPDLAGVQAKN